MYVTMQYPWYDECVRLLDDSTNLEDLRKVALYVQKESFETVNIVVSEEKVKKSQRLSNILYHLLYSIYNRIQHYHDDSQATNVPNISHIIAALLSYVNDLQMIIARKKSNLTEETSNLIVSRTLHFLSQYPFRIWDVILQTKFFKKKSELAAKILRRFFIWAPNNVTTPKEYMKLIAAVRVWRRSLDKESRCEAENYLLSIKPPKRFSKWLKKRNIDNLPKLAKDFTTKDIVDSFLLQKLPKETWNKLLMILSFMSDDNEDDKQLNTKSVEETDLASRASPKLEAQCQLETALDEITTSNCDKSVYQTPLPTEIVEIDSDDEISSINDKNKAELSKLRSNNSTKKRKGVQFNVVDIVPSTSELNTSTSELNTSTSEINNCSSNEINIDVLSQRGEKFNDTSSTINASPNGEHEHKSKKRKSKRVPKDTLNSVNDLNNGDVANSEPVTKKKKRSNSVGLETSDVGFTSRDEQQLFKHIEEPLLVNQDNLTEENLEVESTKKRKKKKKRQSDVPEIAANKQLHSVHEIEVDPIENTEYNKDKSANAAEVEFEEIPSSNTICNNDIDETSRPTNETLSVKETEKDVDEYYCRTLNISNGNSAGLNTDVVLEQGEVRVRDIVQENDNSKSPTEKDLLNASVHTEDLTFDSSNVSDVFNVSELSEDEGSPRVSVNDLQLAVSPEKQSPLKQNQRKIDENESNEAEKLVPVATLSKELEEGNSHLDDTTVIATATDNVEESIDTQETPQSSVNVPSEDNQLTEVQLSTTISQPSEENDLNNFTSSQTSVKSMEGPIAFNLSANVDDTICVITEYFDKCQTSDDELPLSGRLRMDSNSKTSLNISRSTPEVAETEIIISDQESEENPSGNISKENESKLHLSTSEESNDSNHKEPALVTKCVDSNDVNIVFSSCESSPDQNKPSEIQSDVVNSSSVNLKHSDLTKSPIVTRSKTVSSTTTTVQIELPTESNSVLTSPKNVPKDDMRDLLSSPGENIEPPIPYIGFGSKVGDVTNEKENHESDIESDVFQTPTSSDVSDDEEDDEKTVKSSETTEELKRRDETSLTNESIEQRPSNVLEVNNISCSTPIVARDEISSTPVLGNAFSLKKRNLINAVDDSDLSDDSILPENDASSNKTPLKRRHSFVDSDESYSSTSTLPIPDARNRDKDFNETLDTNAANDASVNEDTDSGPSSVSDDNLPTVNETADTSTSTKKTASVYVKPCPKRFKPKQLKKTVKRSLKVNLTPISKIHLETSESSDNGPKDQATQTLIRQTYFKKLMPEIGRGKVLKSRVTPAKQARTRRPSSSRAKDSLKQSFLSTTSDDDAGNKVEGTKEEAVIRPTSTPYNLRQRIRTPKV